MTIEKYKFELLSRKASCATFARHIKKEDITKKNKRMYKRLYKEENEQCEMLQNYINNWNSITINTLKNIENQLNKIKKNKLIPIKKKEKYIKELTIHINYLNAELKK